MTNHTHLIALGLLALAACLPWAETGFIAFDAMLVLTGFLLVSALPPEFDKARLRLPAALCWLAVTAARTHYGLAGEWQEGMTAAWSRPSGLFLGVLLASIPIPHRGRGALPVALLGLVLLAGMFIPSGPGDLGVLLTWITLGEIGCAAILWSVVSARRLA